MKHAILTTTLLLLSLSVVYAQWGWSEGYIVTNTLDTIHGKIQYTTPAIRSAKIMFRADEGDMQSETVRYRPFMIKGFMIAGEYFESRIYDIHPSLNYGLGVFMKRLDNGSGPVKLYEYWNTTQERGFTQLFITREGEPTYQLSTTRLRKQLAQYFKDYEQLHDRILNREFKRRDLPEVVALYNQWKHAK